MVRDLGGAVARSDNWPVKVISISRLDPTAASPADMRGLAELLLDAIDSNAGISFMPGLTEAEAESWWQSVLASSSRRAIVLVARDGSGVVGTVQVQPSWAPNQPHRADVAKLIVHRRSRGQGIATALMRAAEQEAAAAGLTLLLLDTCKGSAAERLYASMGWVRVGEVPGFALNPDGSLCDTVFFYKRLDV
jgi:GNAT superfamily N-acetyltransferase